MLQRETIAVSTKKSQSMLDTVFCLLQISCSSSATVTSSSGSSSSLSSLGSLCRQRSLANGGSCSKSSTSAVSSSTSSYPKAPGFEREDQVCEKYGSRSTNVILDSALNVVCLLYQH